MQKYNNQRVFSCIFEQKTIAEQIDLILAHCAMHSNPNVADFLLHFRIIPLNFCRIRFTALQSFM